MCQCGTVSVLLLLLTVSCVKTQEESSSTTNTVPSVSSTQDPEIFDPKNAYCFEFTWLGPNFDSTVEFDSNCEDFLAENHIANNGVCRQPFLITNDSTPPDLEYLWTHRSYKTRVLRRQRKGEVCAKFSYSFNNELQNITYMRSKVFAEGEGAVTSGCYTQEHGGIESELCVCVPRVGDYFPCNSATPAAAVNVVNVASIAIATVLACMLTRRLI